MGGRVALPILKTLSPRSIRILRSICISSTDISLSPRLGGLSVVVDVVDVVVVVVVVMVVVVVVVVVVVEATACETQATEQRIDRILILFIW